MKWSIYNNDIEDDWWDSLSTHAVDFLTGQSYLTGEMQSFWMAIQGAMMVRNGINKDRHLNWFHAFALSVMTGFAGGWFGFVLMAKPTSMFYNDLNMASCIIAFVLVNYTPMDIGYKLLNTLPLTIVTVSWAQLFRSVGLMKFVDVCFDSFKHMPSKYYPIPVFGPIMYGTLLGNMGGFMLKGLEGHFADGMPWPVQNGLFCGTFYHFYVNDTKGPIGNLLRDHIPIRHLFDVDDKTFAMCFVSFFMQVMGILQIPHLFGPSFTPFSSRIVSPLRDPNTWKVGKITTTSESNGGGSSSKKKKQSKNNKTKEKTLPPQPSDNHKTTTSNDENGQNESSDQLPPNGDTTSSSKRRKRKSKNKEKTS